MPESPVILIIYTTKYRLGGHQFPVVARTLADEKREGGFDGEIVTQAVESKRDVLAAIDEIRQAGKQIKEFIFVGHSGMYGPMYGTVAFPEQFSPYEWEQMDIPFAEDATAYFLLLVDSATMVSHRFLPERSMCRPSDFSGTRHSHAPSISMCRPATAPTARSTPSAARAANRMAISLRHKNGWDLCLPRR